MIMILKLQMSAPIGLFFSGYLQMGQPSPQPMPSAMCSEDFYQELVEKSTSEPELLFGMAYI